jgi:hypothetical protein
MEVSGGVGDDDSTIGAGGGERGGVPTGRTSSKLVRPGRPLRKGGQSGHVRI